MSRSGRLVRNFAFAVPGGIELIPDDPELRFGGRPCFGDIRGDAEFETGRSDHVLDKNPGVDRHQSHGVVGRIEIEDAKVRDDAPDFVKA